MGTKTYKKIRGLLSISQEDEDFPSGHGNLQCFVAKGQYKLIGFPHFCRFKLSDAALTRIAKECAK
jgi:hypothetical protein